ncbi:MAG: hypothetical protein C5B54_01775 [Acidobacteria bacterium]|nr:MAG: hypothetical protein C5B54_01775 [Acidobacteriota bacterium]
MIASRWPWLACAFFLIFQTAIALFYYAENAQQETHPPPNESIAKSVIKAKTLEINTAADRTDENIGKSRLIAYDIFQAADQLQENRNADLFDSYVSLYLPQNPANEDLIQIRIAIENLDQVPLSQQNYTYHVKQTFCEFYRFCLIPILRFQASRDVNLSSEELKEAEISLKKAAEHSSKAGPSLSVIQTRLMEIYSSSGKGNMDPAQLSKYFRRKVPLLRQIIS